MRTVWMPYTLRHNCWDTLFGTSPVLICRLFTPSKDVTCQFVHCHSEINLERGRQGSKRPNKCVYEWRSPMSFFRSAVDRKTDYLTGWGFFHKYSSSFYAILPHFLWRCILPVHWLWPVWEPKCLYWSELLVISGSLYTYRDCRPSIHRILRYTANIWTHHHTNSSLYYFSCHTPLQSHCR